jgi:branched-chain amino acid transport system permease protein
LNVHIFVEQIVNGLVNGCIYALIAIGLTMVYGILHVINLAHGEIFMIGAFVAYACYTLTGSYAVAIVGAILATAFVGLLIERLVFRPLARQARINTLIASVGLSLVLSNAALVLSHGTPHFYLTPLSGQIVHVGFLSITAQRILIVAVTIALIGALTAFYRWSRLGKALRAAAQDLEACSLVGIETRWLVVVSFVLGAALAGVAGSLLSPIYTITYDMGLPAVMKAFAVVIVGGFGNIPGTVLAGVLLGVAESLGGGFISATYQDSIVFVILAIALIVRPTGLVGERVDENI